MGVRVEIGVGLRDNCRDIAEILHGGEREGERGML